MATSVAVLAVRSADAWILGVGPQQVDAARLRLRVDQGIVLLAGQPFTGHALRHYPNGGPAERTSYVDGKRDGLHQMWFEDGTVSFQSHYVDNERHGVTRSWWRNGKLRSESHFERGVAHGVQMQWYVSGAKFKRMNLVHGRQEGLQQSWRDNGTLYNNYEAWNGRTYGLRRSKLCFTLDDEEISIGR